MRRAAGTTNRTPKHTTNGSADVSKSQNSTTTPRPAGQVSFVGSGPGDPDLLTVRAAELIRDAEVVITETSDHVELVRRVLQLPAPQVTIAEDGTETEVEDPRCPEIVDGGFGTDGQPLTHAARAKVVVRHAKSGRRVVRLMAGDPFLFASGPAEAQACVKAGVAFEIVPGVSSASAVPAYAGIPLTTQAGPRDRGHLLRRGQDRLGVVRRRQDAGAARCLRHDRRHRRRARRGRPAARDPGRDDPGRHHHRADHGRVHARRASGRTPARPA